MNREPVITIGSLTALVTAVFALLVAFGLPISNDVQSAILGLVAVAAPLVAAFLSRPKVTPVADPVDNAGNVLTPIGE